MNIQAGDISAAIQRELTLYSQKITEGIKQAAKEVAEKTARELKPVSPKRTGKYSRGWRAKEQWGGFTGARFRVYNTRYQLTHLLEFGHKITRTGKRTRAQPHIKKAEQEAIREFETKVTQIISRG